MSAHGRRGRGRLNIGKTDDATTARSENDVRRTWPAWNDGRGRAARDRDPLEPSSTSASAADPRGRALLGLVLASRCWPGGRRRGERPFFFMSRSRVRGDVVGARSGARARALRAGQGEAVRARLARRDGLLGKGRAGGVAPGSAHDSVSRRSTSCRWRWTASTRSGRHHHGRNQPSGRPGPGARAAGTLRPPGRRSTAPTSRGGGDPARARARRGAEPRRRPAYDRGAHPWLHRRRPRERGE